MGVYEDTRSLGFSQRHEELTLQPRYTNVNTWQAARRSHQACARPLNWLQLDSLIDVGSAVQDAESGLEGTALSTVMHYCMTVCGLDGNNVYFFCGPPFKAPQVLNLPRDVRLFALSANFKVGCSTCY